jgi:molybdopterin/thiamine biosynthesis adenylyltransferase/rhodanese-related sulfurtransferase
MGMKERSLAQLRHTIPHIGAAQVQDAVAAGAVLIDIREHDERAAGAVDESIHLPRSFLELQIEAAVPDAGRRILLMCAGGTRSLFAAGSLRQLGYADVHSVAGGFSAWKDAGLAFSIPRILRDSEKARYARQVLLPQVGVPGQVRLLNARVLLIGAGGLGCPSAIYLAAAGVGTLGVVDDDTVEVSNLHRQILHTEAMVGLPKVASMAQRIAALNSSVNVIAYQTRLTAANADQIVSSFDVVIDGSDNFVTRYLVNDACVRHGKPLVHASVFKFEGQASVFWPNRGPAPAPCYRCMFPEPPAADLAPSCAEAGVLGVLPGLLGLIQATETLKIILGIGAPLVGRMLCVDAAHSTYTELQIDADPACVRCSDPTAALQAIDLPGACAIEGGGAQAFNKQ